MTKQKQDLETLPPSIAKGAIIVFVVVFLFVFIVMVSLMRSCASSFSTPPVTTPETTTQPASTYIEVGDTITVGPNAFVCPTKADFDECTRLSVAKDYLGLGEMEANGQLYLVDVETKALVIGEAFGSWQVRIESGDYFGKSGWAISASCKK